MLMFKSTHEMKLQLQRLEMQTKIEKAEALAVLHGNNNRHVRQQLESITRNMDKLTEYLVRQGKNLESKDREIRLLSGNRRTEKPPETKRTEEVEVDPYLRPDVQVHEETAAGELAASTQLKDLEGEFNRILDEIGGAVASPEAIAAQPTSLDEWEDEHRDTKQDNAKDS